MNPRPLIDVIIPAYNAQEYIIDAIDSVLSQTLKPNRIIVVDDGSTDNTSTIVNRIKKKNSLITIITSTHKNAASARNAGLAASSAPLVAFLDSDDIWEPNKLEKQIEVLNNLEDGVGVVYSSYCNIDEKGKILTNFIVQKPQHSGAIFSEILKGACISGSASGVLIKKKYLDEAGWFDTNLVFAEDWDLWIRLAKVCKFSYSSESLVRIRIHNQSFQRKKSRKKQLLFLEDKCSIVAKYQNILFSDIQYLSKLKNEILTTFIRNIYRPIQVCTTLNKLRKLGIKMNFYDMTIRLFKISAKIILNKLKVI